MMDIGIVHGLFALFSGLLWAEGKKEMRLSQGGTTALLDLEEILKIFFGLKGLSKTPLRRTV